jgi:transcriptional regulator with XRE-family HTH domain
MHMKRPSGFAARLRELREAAGLTQRRLAEEAGMHTLGVAKLEQGLREPSWATVRCLARALGLNCLHFEVETPADPPAAPKGRPRKGAPSAPKRRGRRKT